MVFVPGVVRHMSAVILRAFIPMPEAHGALSLLGDACVCFSSTHEYEIEVIFMMVYRLLAREGHVKLLVVFIQV